MQIRKFQEKGIREIIKRKKVLLADDMGCGKTLQAVISFLRIGKFPVAVVVPATLTYNWVDELGKWAPDLTYQVLDNDKFEKAQVYIISYDRLRRGIEKVKTGKSYRYFIGPGSHLDRLSKLVDVVVLDESHYIKSETSLRTKACMHLLEDKSYRMLLTGTPMKNRPLELYPQLKALDATKPFGDYMTFIHRYCDARKVFGRLDASGASNLELLNKTLLSTVMIRRTRSEVLTELPPSKDIFLPMPLSNPSEYRKAEEGFLSWLKQACKADYQLQNSIKDLSAQEQGWLREKYSRETVERARRAEALVRMSRLRRVSANGKMKAYLEWRSNVNDKLITFAFHKEVQYGLIEALPGCARLIARDSPKVRMNNVRAFQEDENYMDIVCSIRVGGEGFTMTAAKTVAFVEFPWTPADVEQAKARAHRLGQVDTVLNYFIYAPGTVDQYLLGVLNKKHNVISSAIDGAGALMDVYKEKLC